MEELTEQPSRATGSTSNTPEPFYDVYVLAPHDRWIYYGVICGHKEAIRTLLEEDGYDADDLKLIPAT